MSLPDEWPVAMLDALIKVEQSDQPCWRVGKYLGSMLTFDFGGRVPTRTMRGSTVDLGTSTIGVRDVWWRASGAGLEPFDSDDVAEGRAEWRRLEESAKGACLSGLEREEEGLVLVFSNRLRLELDTTNVYGEEADAAVWVLQLSGGPWFDVTPNGRILLNREASKGGREREAA